MLRATYRGHVLAETPRTVRLEGNHYFPPDSLRADLLDKSRTRTLCPWKGIARYYNLRLDDQVAADVGWVYHHPSPLARRIKDHMAFCPGVVIEGEPDQQPPRLSTRLRRLFGTRP
ncbi:MAG: DUF427 domain-containing protein [Pseudonocardiaceae bacterium]